MLRDVAASEWVLVMLPAVLRTLRVDGSSARGIAHAGMLYKVKINTLA